MEVSKRDKPSDYTVLNEMFEGKIEETELSEHLKKKLRRIRACHAMLLNAQSTYAILQKLKDSFGISQAQAYRELSLTEKLFGALRKSNKAIKRQIAENMALKTFRLAKARGELKVMAQATKAYIDATGCAIDDPEMPDFDKIQPSINIITVSKELLKRIEGNMSKGPVVRKMEDYAEYTEVSEDA